MKRGQFEILGLAILIVLIILGLLLFFMFGSRQVDDAVGTFENEQLAQNFVDAFLRTPAGPACPDQPDATMYDLVRDAALLDRKICGGNIESKTILQKAAEDIIKETTGSLYRFSIYKESDRDNPLAAANTCPTGARTIFDRTGEQRLRLLPTSDTAVVSLQLCRSPLI